MNNPIIRFKKVDGSDFSDWKESSFQEIFEFRSSISLSRSQLNYTNGEVKNIHYGDILLKFPSIIHTDNKLIPYINQDCIPNKYDRLEKGDVVFADTAEDYSLGKAIEIGSTPFRITSGLHTIACKTKLKFASGFLVYYLNSNFYHRQINKLATGTKVYSIIKSNIIKTKLRTPSSLEEQQKIASFFSTLDQKIELNERKLEALEKLKKGVMQKIFKRAIRFKKNGEDFPKWNKVKIQETGEIRTGTTPKNNQEGVYGGPHYWVTPTDIKSKEIYQTNKTLTDSGLQSGRVIPANSVLVTCIASIGKNAILRRKGSCNQQINAITPNQNFNVDFVYYAITHAEPILHRLAGQGGMEIINKRDFSEVELFVPCLEEQNAIAAFLSSLDRKIQISSERINNLNSLKQGFMQQMFV